MGKKRRSFSKDFKLEAVKLVKEGRLNVARAAKDLGIYETSLRRWIKQFEVDHGEGSEGELTSSEKEELRHLRRENRTLRMEREVLKNDRGAGHQPVETETPSEIVFYVSTEGSGRELFGGSTP